MRARNLFLVLVLFSLLVLAGCKKECSVASDCLEKTCKTASCVKSMCSYATKTNCCGNGKCDSTENWCKCNTDCKPACKGAVGKFMQYACDENKECMLTSNRINNTVLDEHKFSFFTLGITSRYEEPYDLAKSSFTVNIELKDNLADLVFPVKITGVRLVERDTLLGEASTDIALGAVRDNARVDIPISFDVPGNESSKTVALKVDYEYIKQIRGSYNNDIGGYEYTNSPIQRDTYTKTFSTKIDFIDSSKH